MAENIGDLSVRITGDDSELQKAIDAAAKTAQDGATRISSAFAQSFKSSDEGLKQFVDSMGKFSPAADSIIQKQKQLDDELIRAKGALVEVQQAYDAGAVSVNTLVRAQDAVSEAAAKANIAFKEEETVVRSLADTLRDAGASMTALGNTLTLELTAPIVAFGTAAALAANQFDEAFDHLRASTGQTGVELKGLEDIFRNVFATVPATAKDVGDAIAALAQRTNLVGPELEKLTTQVLNLAHVTGSQVGPLIQSVTRLFGDWGIKTNEQAETLDTLFKAFQKTGVGVTELSKLVVQFGAPLRALGFSFEEALVTMGKFQKEGVNLQTALSGLRFALGSFAKAGEDPVIALQEMIDKIKNTDDATEALALSFQTFGKRAAADLFDVIKGGHLDLDELMKAIADGHDTINQAAEDTKSFAEKWQLFKNNLEAALEPLGETLISALEGFMREAKPAIGLLKDLGDAFNSLDTGTKTVAITVIGFAVAAGPALVTFGYAAKGAAAALDVMGISLKGVALAGAALRGIAWLAIAAEIATLAKAFYDLKVAKDSQAQSDRELTDSLARLEISLRQQGADITELSRQYNQGEISFASYLKRLREIAVAIGDSIPKTAAATASVQKHGAAHEEAAPKVKKAADEVTQINAYLKEMTDLLKQIQAPFQIFSDTSEAAAQALLLLVSAHKDIIFEQQKLIPLVDASAIAMDMLAQAMHQISAEGPGTVTVLDETGQAAKDLGGYVTVATTDTVKLEDQIAKTSKNGQSAIKELNRAIERDLSKALADVITRTGDLGKAFAKVGTDIVAIVVDHIIAKALKPLLDALDKVLVKIPGLGSIPGAGGGGGASVPTGGGGGGGGGGTGGGASSMLGTVTSLATLGVDIAAGITQGIQMSRLINLTGEIEISTRQVKEQLVGGVQPRLDMYLPELKHLVDIWGVLEDIKSVLWRGVVNVNVIGSSGQADNRWADVNANGNGPAAILDKTPEKLAALGLSTEENTGVTEQNTAEILNLAKSVSRSTDGIAQLIDAEQLAADIAIDSATKNAVALAGFSQQQIEAFAGLRQALTEGTGPASGTTAQIEDPLTRALRQLQSPASEAGAIKAALINELEGGPGSTRPVRGLGAPEPGTQDYLDLQFLKGQLTADQYRTAIADQKLQESMQAVADGIASIKPFSTPFGSEQPFTTPVTRGEMTVSGAATGPIDRFTADQVKTATDQYRSALETAAAALEQQRGASNSLIATYALGVAQAEARVGALLDHFDSPQQLADWLAAYNAKQPIHNAEFGDITGTIYNQSQSEKDLILRLRGGLERTAAPPIDVAGMTADYQSALRNTPVTVYAVDPSGRQLTNSIITGLQRNGIRIR